MKLIKKLTLSLLTIGTLVSCSLDELRENPNATSPDKTDPVLLLNGVQTNFASFVSSAQSQPMGAVRMTAMSGVYNNAYSAQGFNGKWRSAYAGVLADAKTLNKIVGDKVEYRRLSAVNDILVSYTLTTLVDYFGDVPYKSASLFAENENPSLDSGQELYGKALELLDSAIEKFATVDDSSIKLTSDLYYDGSEAKWIKLANTLKLRIYNNTRLVDSQAKDKINALLAEDDFIEKDSENFVWKYGTNDNDPDVRSDFFVGALSRGPYLGQYFMNILKNDYTAADPRIYYYLYRQAEDYPEFTEEGLFNRPCMKYTKPSHYKSTDAFCNSIGDAYWGRDHGNTSGVPSDEGMITIFGLYPFGTKFDDDSFKTLSRTAGAEGKGYFPILMNSWVSFMRAEAAYTLNTTDNAKDLMLDGIKKSLETVMNFNTEVVAKSDITNADDTKSPHPNSLNEAKINGYLQLIGSEYDAGTAKPGAENTADPKFDLIMRQFYISCWGNGHEAYNNYRRTGCPSDIQPNIESSPGEFISSFLYPTSAVNNNTNIDQKANQTVKVFWDVQTTVNINK